MGLKCVESEAANILNEATILTRRHKYVVTICESNAAFRKIELVSPVKFFWHERRE